MELLTSGIALGCLYAIVSLGFVIIYRGSQVMNFAHGEFLTVGAFVMVSLVEDAGLPWGVGFPLALIVTGFVAVAIERGILRFLIGRPVFVTIIMTLFVGLVLRIAVILVWGVDQRGMPTAWDSVATISVFGSPLLINNLWAIIASVVCLLFFFVIQKYSRFGLAMRATSFDQETSLALGIPVGRIFASTWFLAGAFGALGGIFVGMFPNSVDPTIGFIAFRAFPAVIVGGLDSPLGAVIASIGLGLLEVFTQRYLNASLGEFGKDLHVVMPYVVMILFMTVRPYGIFGKKEVERA